MTLKQGCVVRHAPLDKLGTLLAMTYDLKAFALRHPEQPAKPACRRTHTR